MKAQCHNCNKEFDAPKHNVLRGYGKYCSRACRNTGAKLGFKKGHGSYWTDESREKFKKSMSGARHFAWKGGKAGKVAKHMWIDSVKGKPKECEHCGVKDESKVYDWANVDHKYSRDPDDYMRLCRSCHRKYDYQVNYA